MEGILWLLLVGALFYFMMRFGCGAHMVHGGHDGAGERASAGMKDPVCGMDVAPRTGYARHYEGREYRFCSRKCLDTFDAEAARYTGLERSKT
jgi:YHS domain-containing protein